MDSRVDPPKRISNSKDMIEALNESLNSSEVKQQISQSFDEYIGFLDLAISTIKPYLKQIGKLEFAEEFVDDRTSSAYKCAEFGSDINKALVNFWMLADATACRVLVLKSELTKVMGMGGGSSELYSRDTVTEYILMPFWSVKHVLGYLDSVMQLRDLVAKEHAKVMARLSPVAKPTSEDFDGTDEHCKLLKEVYCALNCANEIKTANLTKSLETIRDTVRKVVYRWTQGDGFVRDMVWTFNDSQCSYLSDLTAPWPNYDPIDALCLQEEEEAGSQPTVLSGQPDESSSVEPRETDGVY